MDNAIILTAGVLTGSNAKTGHGLIRKTSRYNILAVIDDKTAGQDAGFVLDKVDRQIPVYATIHDFIQRSDKPAQYAVVGVAFADNFREASNG